MVVRGLLLLLQRRGPGHGLPPARRRVQLPRLPLGGGGVPAADAGLAVLPARRPLRGPFARGQGRGQVLRHVPDALPAAEVLLLPHGLRAAGAAAGLLGAGPALLPGRGPGLRREALAQVPGLPHPLAHSAADGRLPVDRVHAGGAAAVEAGSRGRQIQGRRHARSGPAVGRVRPRARVRRPAALRHGPDWLGGGGTVAIPAGAAVAPAAHLSDALRRRRQPWASFCRQQAKDLC
mmetsp:Transcript_10349/g.30387  ORF Transcript_10349/g.30387 Transcript_10349/m.30387 type:complete len:235 (+) Transcript_10349:214-918(+)